MQGKNLRFFHLETLKNCMRHFTHRWLQAGYFFSKFGLFFPIFEKRQGRPLPPSSYALARCAHCASSTAHKHIYNNCLLRYLSLQNHNKYRCKEMLDDFNYFGLCQDYKVVLKYLTSLRNEKNF